MKLKNKIILLITLVGAVFTLLSVTAFAEEEHAGSNAPSEISEDENIPSDDHDAAIPDTSSVFDEIYRRLAENADKIFAALAFIGTMIVSLAYKKGLLPLLGGAVSYLKGSVESIKESGTALSENTDRRFGVLCENMNEVLRENENTLKAIESINERLLEVDSMAKRYESTNLILSSQVDMLYTIFMSSALPQYQKEEVGERISRMKEELKKHENLEE